MSDRHPSTGDDICRASTKSCSNCKQPRSLVDGFYKNKVAKDGLESWCKTCFKQNQKRYQQGPYKDKKRLLNEIYKQRYPDRYQASIDNWTLKNRDKYLARFAKYQRAKRQATPAWLTTEQLEVIDRFHRTCPEGWHVDHIVPIQGRSVSGLHVPWNLQHLTASKNRKKTNKY